MTTVEDKLKVFAKIIFEKVEKDSEEKVEKFTKCHDLMLEQEKKNILKESENMIKQARKKAELKKNEIISKANTDRQHMLLQKRKELFDRMVEYIRNYAVDFTKQPEYLLHLEKCISNGISQIDGDDIMLFFKHNDIEQYGESINEFVCKYKKPGMTISVEETNRDILGGCICEDKSRTMRIDCSMASAIDDNKGLIGKVLMDNLQ